MAVVKQAIAATLVVAVEEATSAMLHEMSVVTAAEGAIGRGSARRRSATRVAHHTGGQRGGVGAVARQCHHH
jgi:hypothetical protein